jgi:hypothetical protein
LLGRRETHTGDVVHPRRQLGRVGCALIRTHAVTHAQTHTYMH